jgi:hypothetical protein
LRIASAFARSASASPRRSSKRGVGDCGLQPGREERVSGWSRVLRNLSSSAAQVPAFPSRPLVARWLNAHEYLLRRCVRALSIRSQVMSSRTNPQSTLAIRNFTVSR